MTDDIKPKRVATRLKLRHLWLEINLHKTSDKIEKHEGGGQKKNWIKKKMNQKNLSPNCLLREQVNFYAQNRKMRRINDGLGW